MVSGMLGVAEEETAGLQRPHRRRRRRHVRPLVNLVREEAESAEPEAEHGESLSRRAVEG